MNHRWLTQSIGVLLGWMVFCPGRAVALDGELALSAIDRETGKPIAVRVHLINAATKKPVKVAGAPALGDHFAFYDTIQLKLPLGSYQFIIERGPEYLVRTGHFTLNHYANDRKTVDMKRFVDMAAEGWYAGDLDVRRGERDIELLMQAEDLFVAQLIVSAGDKPRPNAPLGGGRKPVASNEPMPFDIRRFFCRAVEVGRDGNALLLFNVRNPDGLTDGKIDVLADLTAQTAAGRANAWADVARPFAVDLPRWVAAGTVDSIQVVNRHLLRDGVIDGEAGGYARDRALYPGTQGNGRWSLDIYYHLLNCGLRLPPTAGSGSGWTPPTDAAPGTAAAIKAAASGNFNPPGYNRVYVYVDGELTWEKWWEGLRAGRAVVTNGPLLRASVEGQPPGHVFQAPSGQTLELEIGLSLSMRDNDKVSYLEIIRDGAVEHSVRLDRWKENQGKLPPVKFDRSGWFLVRAVTDVPKTYRYAMTAPYYVEIGDSPSVNRASAQFFVDWCRKRIEELDEPAAQEDWNRAFKYWTDMAQRANVP